jgi:hypothetical protein
MLMNVEGSQFLVGASGGIEEESGGSRQESPAGEGSRFGYHFPDYFATARE